MTESKKIYGDTKESKCKDSSCCYIDGHGLQIGKSEIERLVDAVNKRPQEFIPKYLPKIKRILGKKDLIKFNGEKVKIKGDKSKNFIVMGMTDYHPCPFLNIVDGSTSCIVYPYRFQICKNTSCEDCYSSD